MILKIVRRELRNNWKFSLLLLLNFSIGLLGFVSLNTFQISLQDVLTANSKNFLSADFAIQARRLLSEPEQNQIKSFIKTELGSDAEVSRMMEFFGMSAANQESNLVNIKAVEAAYPFYGYLKLGSGKVARSGDLIDLQNEKIAWVYPEVLVALNLNVGDSMNLGSTSFKIADTIVDDASQTFRLASLAPRVYIGYRWINDTGLVSFGSTVSDILLIKTVNELDPKGVKESFAKLITDTSIRLSTQEDAEEGSARVLNYLTDYLSLVALVALFLSSLGASFIYRSYLASSVKSMAIWQSLGLTKDKVQSVYLIQVMVVSFAASLCSYVVAYLAMPVLEELLKTFSPVDFDTTPSIATFLVALVTAVLGAALLAIPQLVQIKRLSVAQLFREEASLTTSEVETMPWSEVLFYLPSVAFFWFLSVWQAHSLKIGSAFFFGFLGSALVLWLIGIAVLKFLALASKSGPWYLRYAIMTVTRRRSNSVLVILSLGLASLLLNLMPVLKSSLKQEIEAPKNITLPSLFIFDIQDEQVQGIKDLASQNGWKLNQMSPLIRSRILSINGQNFERVLDTSIAASREEEAEVRFRNRGVNLSYRESLSESETLIEGSWFDPSNSEMQLSVEERYARRMGMKIGDRVKFDIQGIEIEGLVTSLRSVKWNSFSPNFFVLVSPGIIEEAPKTWLASMPAVEGKSAPQVQREILKNFGNISVVDVRATLKKIYDLSVQMSWALELMALLSLLAGTVVVVSMARQQVQSRNWDLNMLKILGATERSLLYGFMIEFTLLALIGALFGIVLSYAVGFGIVYFVFDGVFQIVWLEPILSLLVILALVSIVAVTSLYSLVRQKPALSLSNKS